MAPSRVNECRRTQMQVTTKMKRVLVPAAVTVAIALAFAAGRHGPDGALVGAASAATVSSSTTAPSPRATPPLPDFAALVERHGAAVVAIAVTKTGGSAAAGADAPEFGDDGPMGEFL